MLVRWTTGLPRSFLGYPLSLAPASRYQGLYDEVVKAHAGKKNEALTAQQLG